VGDCFGFTVGALVVVVVRGVVVVVVGVVLLGVLVVYVVVAARGVESVPVHAPRARQATANQTVRRMVTEGSPPGRPNAPTTGYEGVRATLAGRGQPQ
jgi:hypothetical protein